MALVNITDDTKDWRLQLHTGTEHLTGTYARWCSDHQHSCCTRLLGCRLEKDTLITRLLHAAPPSNYRPDGHMRTEGPKSPNEKHPKQLSLRYNVWELAAPSGADEVLGADHSCHKCHMLLNQQRPVKRSKTCSWRKRNFSSTFPEIRINYKPWCSFQYQKRILKINVVFILRETIHAVCNIYEWAPITGSRKS